MVFRSTESSPVTAGDVVAEAGEQRHHVLIFYQNTVIYLAVDPEVLSTDLCHPPSGALCSWVCRTGDVCLWSLSLQPGVVAGSAGCDQTLAIALGHCPRSNKVNAYCF